MPYNYPAQQPTQQNFQQSQQQAQPFPSVPAQQVQPLFPQPQGNVYNINSTLEVANVPVGAGVSVALCMPENVMFIKTMQNGQPLFYPYKIMPFSNENETPNTTESDTAAAIKDLSERLETIENSLKKKKGADFDI